MDEQKKKKIYIVVIIISTIIIGIVAALFLIDAIEKSNFNNGVEKITKAVKTGFPGANSIEVSGHTIYIRVWTDGIFEASRMAASGNKTALKQWDELKDNLYLTVCEMCDHFFWVKDETIYMMLVDDFDHDKELLVYENRNLLYDGVYDHICKNGGSS